MDTQDLRHRIHDARVASGLFEDDMAAQYGLTMEYYRAFEQGRAELPEATILMMAGDLGIERTAGGGEAVTAAKAPNDSASQRSA